MITQQERERQNSLVDRHNREMQIVMDNTMTGFLFTKKIEDAYPLLSSSAQKRISLKKVVCT